MPETTGKPIHTVGELMTALGFTREDVRDLRGIAQDSAPTIASALNSIADRIAALLPPED